MTTRFLESFDHYTTLAQKWTSITTPGIGCTWTIAPASARTGPNGLGLRHATASYIPTAFIPNLPVAVTYIMGFAFQTSVLPTGNRDPIVATVDGMDMQGTLALAPTGALVLLRGGGGGAVVATSVRTLTAATWYYVEFRHTVGPAAGVLEVRVNEEIWATFTGNTQATPNTRITAITLGGAIPAGVTNTPTFRYDDIYVNDTAGGTPNNTYWGVSAVEAILPGGAGNHTEWATLVGAATHWQAVSEVPPDEDVSYVASPTVNQRDTFAMANLGVLSAQINAVQFGARVRQEQAGQGAFARMYRRAGADNQGADTPVGVAYINYREVMETDPIAGAAWSVDNVNASEFGVRVR